MYLFFYLFIYLSIYLSIYLFILYTYITWHDITLHCITLHSLALHCIVVQCTAVQCVVFHSIPFRSVPFHPIQFHSITLHYIYICMYIYIYTWLWFPKCLPTVSGPSIVPCHNMGQSHHHLRLPINVGSRPHLRNSWENSADAILVVAERGGPYFIWKGVDTLDFWLNNRLGNHFRWDLLWSIGSCQWDCCCSHTWLYIYISQNGDQ
jgi:hypothetical protein